MCELTKEAYEADTLQYAIRAAREIALRSHEKWAKALHDLYGAAENDVIFAAMDGDECHAGRVLIQRLRESVIAEATQATKDASEEAAETAFEAGIDRQIAAERRACEAERAHRAMTEGTP
jgi:hypothetical protein